MLCWTLQTYSFHPCPPCSPPLIFIRPVPILTSIISWPLTSNWFWWMRSTRGRKEREGGVSPGVYKLVSFSVRSPELAVPLDDHCPCSTHPSLKEFPVPSPPLTVLLLLFLNFCTLPCGSPSSQPERRERSLQRRNDYQADSKILNNNSRSQKTVEQYLQSADRKTVNLELYNTIIQ